MNATEGSFSYIPSRISPVTTLAFHVCHDCNLACRYCYASGGAYGGPKAYMSEDVADAGLGICAVENAITIASSRQAIFSHLTL